MVTHIFSKLLCLSTNWLSSTCTNSFCVSMNLTHTLNPSVGVVCVIALELWLDLPLEIDEGQ